jgi:hypothetical protein
MLPVRHACVIANINVSNGSAYVRKAKLVLKANKRREISKEVILFWALYLECVVPNKEINEAGVPYVSKPPYYFAYLFIYYL